MDNATANLASPDPKVAINRDPKMWAKLMCIMLDINGPREWSKIRKMDMKYKLGRVVGEFAFADATFIDEVLEEVEKTFAKISKTFSSRVIASDDF